MSEPAVEELLPALFDSAKGDPRAPRDVYRRLQFLARILRQLPPSDDGRTMLVWFDAREEVASVSLGNTDITIGREAACEVKLGGLRVSRRHCGVRLRRNGGGEVEIEDLGSRNGTLVNGRPLELGAHALKHGDVIEVGGVALAVVTGH